MKFLLLPVPNVHYMNREELEAAEISFKNRAIQYFENLEIAIHENPASA